MKLLTKDNKLTYQFPSKYKLGQTLFQGEWYWKGSILKKTIHRIKIQEIILNGSQTIIYNCSHHNYHKSTKELKQQFSKTKKEAMTKLNKTINDELKSNIYRVKDTIKWHKKQLKTMEKTHKKYKQ